MCEGRSVLRCSASPTSLLQDKGNDHLIPLLVGAVVIGKLPEHESLLNVDFYPDEYGSQNEEDEVDWPTMGPHGCQRHEEQPLMQP